MSFLAPPSAPAAPPPPPMPATMASTTANAGQAAKAAAAAAGAGFDNTLTSSPQGAPTPMTSGATAGKQLLGQ